MYLVHETAHKELKWDRTETPANKCRQKYIYYVCKHKCYEQKRGVMYNRGYVECPYQETTTKNIL